MTAMALDGGPPKPSAVAALRLPGRIAFTETTHTDLGLGPSEIKVLDMHTGGIRPVTDTTELEQGAVWSPDGKRLAYSAIGDGIEALYTIRADGKDRHRIVSVERKLAYDPTWSPDGRRIAFVLNDHVGGTSEIEIVNADGTGRHTLKNVGGWAYAPAWSPDGRKIAFQTYIVSDEPLQLVHDELRYSATVPFIYVHDLRTGYNDLITSGYEPAWSPDGKRLLFTGSEGNGIKVFDLRRRKETEILHGYWDDDPDNIYGWARQPTWSPDGKWIAFVEQAYGYGFAWHVQNSSSIWVMRADGEKRTRLLEGLVPARVAGRFGALTDYWAPTWTVAR